VPNTAHRRERLRIWRHCASRRAELLDEEAREAVRQSVAEADPELRAGLLRPSRLRLAAHVDTFAGFVSQASQRCTPRTRRSGAIAKPTSRRARERAMACRSVVRSCANPLTS